MGLWLAVDHDNNSLGVVQAESSEQAFYQFMVQQIYPDRVILLPDTLVLRENTELADDPVWDEEHSDWV